MRRPPLTSPSGSVKTSPGGTRASCAVAARGSKMADASVPSMSSRLCAPWMEAAAASSLSPSITTLLRARVELPTLPIFAVSPVGANALDIPTHDRRSSTICLLHSMLLPSDALET